MKKALRVILCCLLAFTMIFAFGCNANKTPENPGTNIGGGTGDNNGDNTGDNQGGNTGGDNQGGNQGGTSGPDESYDEYVDWTTISEWTPQNIKYRPVTNRDILIGSYVSYCDTAVQKSAKAQLKILADGGLNFMPLAHLTPSFGLIEQGERVRRDLHSVDWWKKIDDEMVKRNMVYYYSSAPRVGFDTQACANVDVMTNASAIAAAKKIVPQLENCIGYHVVDEPAYSEFDVLAAAAKQYSAIKPNMDVMVNFTGGPREYNGSGGYYGFLKSWIDKCGGSSNINVLSHDSYPFCNGGPITGFQSSLETMRGLSIENEGLKLGCFLQSCAWDGWYMPNFDEIKWMMNSYLASGFSQFIYFNYAMYPNEGCSDAIIAQNGTILHKDLYDALAAYHYQVRAMGVNCRFTDLSAKTVYYTAAAGKPGNVSQLPETGEYVLRDGLAGGNGFIVSYLQNATETEKYMIIVNNSSTAAYGDKTFKTGAKADALAKMELYNLETGKFESLWNLGDSSFTLSFGKGDIKIIKLTNK